VRLRRDGLVVRAGVQQRLCHGRAVLAAALAGPKAQQLQGRHVLHVEERELVLCMNGVRLGALAQQVFQDGGLARQQGPEQRRARVAVRPDALEVHRFLRAQRLHHCCDYVDAPLVDGILDDVHVAVILVRAKHVCVPVPDGPGQDLAHFAGPAARDSIEYAVCLFLHDGHVYCVCR
jgi:hypothetical protein